MKTLGELRELIAQNEGVLKIGHLQFKWDSESDVDVYLEGDLICWFSKTLRDDDLLSNGEGNPAVERLAERIREAVR